VENVRKKREIKFGSIGFTNKFQFFLLMRHTKCEGENGAKEGFEHYISTRRRRHLFVNRFFSRMWKKNKWKARAVSLRKLSLKLLFMMADGLALSVFKAIFVDILSWYRQYETEKFVGDRDLASNLLYLCTSHDRQRRLFKLNGRCEKWWELCRPAKWDADI
jgi:hypothetical protein